MKQASNRIILSEILSLILTTFNEEGETKRGTGKSSFIAPLTKSLNRFLEINRLKFSLLYSKYNGKVSESLIQRAFNFKSPSGATKELRNLLCYYATKGKENWNEVVLRLFPNYIYLVDDPVNQVIQSSTNRSLVDVLSGLTDLESNVPKGEINQPSNLPEKVDGENYWTVDNKSVLQITPKQTLLSIYRKDYIKMDSKSFYFFFKIMSKFNININFMQNSEKSFTVCIDSRPDLMASICKELRPLFSALYNENTFIVTINNWNDLLINHLRINHPILAELRTRRTTYIVLQDNLPK